MTDLEITRLCAEAMGVTGDPALAKSVNPAYALAHCGYSPLTNDAQCMALVKRFDIVIERERSGAFGVTLFGNERKGGHPTFVVRNQPDLNRAVCECVAKMQQAHA